MSPELRLKENLALFKKLKEELRSAKVLSPDAEAENMIVSFGRVTRLDFFTGRKKLGFAARRRIRRTLALRKKGKPLQHLIGEAPFFGRTFRVTKHTLIPRPETEVLVQEALDVLKAGPKGGNPEVLDIGTGSGCIAVSLTLDYPDCKMTALDSSRPALSVARKNLRMFGLGKNIHLVHSRLFGSFGKRRAAFWDMIVSNPPYIPAKDLKGLSKEVRSEPRQALDGGTRGLQVIRLLLDKAPKFLRPGGKLLMEIGDGQSGPIQSFLRKSRLYKDFRFVRDLNGIDRVLVATANG